MGGDLQMDMEFEILKKVGVKFDKEDYKPVQNKREIRELLTKKQNVALATCRSEAKQHRKEERTIPIQVLGVLLMRYGCAINENVMSALLRSCKNDHWAKCSMERAVHVRQFEEILKSYDHKTPTNEYIDYKKTFGATGEDFLKRGFSGKVALMALHYVHHGWKKHSWYCDSKLIAGNDGWQVLVYYHQDKVKLNDLIANDNRIFEVKICFIDSGCWNPNYKNEEEDKYKNMECILSNKY